MMKIVLLLASVLVTEVAASATPYNDQIGVILQCVSSTNREVRLNVTNRIDELMKIVTNREELATCKLLKAKVRLECADITGEHESYDDNAYCEVTNLCWGVANEFASDKGSWRLYGALLMLPLPLSMNSRYEEMFCVATNALASVNAQSSIFVDGDVWMALFGKRTLQVEDVKVAMRTLAASSLLLSDSTANVFFYTNGLPVEALSVIESIECGERR